MDPWRRQLTDAVNNRKGDVADAIGMPDEQDYEVLLKIIQRYDKTHPGFLSAARNAGRRDYEAGVHHKKRTFDKQSRAVISKDTNMTYAMELPADLVTAIERVFPSLFRSKKHFQWFKKNFSSLTITGDDR